MTTPELNAFKTVVQNCRFRSLLISEMTTRMMRCVEVAFREDVGISVSYACMEVDVSSV